MFLQSTVAVLFAFLSGHLSHTEGRICGAIEFEEWVNPRRPAPSSVRNCTTATSVLITQRSSNVDWNLGFLSSLQKIRGDWQLDRRRNAIPLDIHDTSYLLYTPETFFPNLTNIIPHPGHKRSAILIRGNNLLCIPDRERERLLKLVDYEGYIQPCSLFETYENNNILKSQLVEIVGGDRCVIISGVLGFTENSVLTEKLRRQLSSVEELRGRIDVVGTNFTTLDFLQNLRRIYYADDATLQSVVRISQNWQLTKLGFMPDILVDSSPPEKRGPLLAIWNNAQLRFTAQELEYYKRHLVSELDYKQDKNPVHFASSYCQVANPVWKNKYSVMNCIHVEGDLIIDESFNHLSINEMEELFGFMRELRGCLTIRKTNFRNLVFLHSLFWVQCFDRNTSAALIEDNPKLERLDLQLHKFEDSSAKWAFEIKNNPKICQSEVAYLADLLSRTGERRKIDFDGREKECSNPSKSYPNPIGFFYAAAGGILLFGGAAAHVVIRLDERKRRRKRNRGEERKIETTNN